MVDRPYNGFPAEYRNKQGRRVYNAFRTGQLQRPTECRLCGLTADRGATVQAHNEDYHEPFTYIGICFCCHMAVHRRFKDLPTWHRYRRLVATGWQPIRTRHYEAFMRMWERLPEPDPTVTPDYSNWAYLLSDNEPDLYSLRPPGDEGLF